MFFLILPLTFLAVAIPLIEPLNLVRSFVIVSVTFILFISSRTSITKRVVKTPAAMLMTLILGYIVSGVANNQTVASQLLGGYNRNQGLLIWISFTLIFIMALENKISTKQFNIFGLFPLLILSVVYGFIQILELDPIVWAESGVVLTLGNSNFAAPVLAILGIYCLSRVFETKKKSELLQFAIAGIVSVVVGIETNTLQYPVLVFFGVFVYSLLYKKNLHGIKLRLSNFVLILVSTTAIFVAVLKWNLIYSAGNAVDRIDSIRAGFQVWMGHPIFGVGIEQLFKFSPEFRTERQFEAYGSLVVIDKAHNIVVDHFSNGGIIVGLAFLGYIVWILALIFKINKKQLTTLQRNRFAFLSAIWLIWFGQALIGPDNNLLTLIGIIAGGLISQTYFSQEEILMNANSKVRQSPRKYQDSAIVGLLLISLFAFSSSIVSHREAKLVTENQITDVKRIEKIINRWPTPKMTEIVLVHLIKNQKNCPYIISLIEDFKSQNPRSAQAYYFSAICKSFERKDQSALNDIELGLKYDPLNIDLLIADFRLNYALNDIYKSKVALKKILILDPTNDLLEGYPDFVVD
jgi:hypothetical protein